MSCRDSPLASDHSPLPISHYPFLVVYYSLLIRHCPLAVVAIATLAIALEKNDDLIKARVTKGGNINSLEKIMIFFLAHVTGGESINPLGKS